MPNVRVFTRERSAMQPRYLSLQVLRYSLARRLIPMSRSKISRSFRFLAGEPARFQTTIASRRVAGATVTCVTLTVGRGTGRASEGTRRG